MMNDDEQLNVSWISGRAYDFTIRARVRDNTFVFVEHAGAALVWWTGPVSGIVILCAWMWANGYMPDVLIGSMPWTTFFMDGLVLVALLGIYRCIRMACRRKRLTVDMNARTVELVETWPKPFKGVIGFEALRVETRPMTLRMFRYTWEGFCLSAWVDSACFAIAARKSLKDVEDALPTALKEAGVEPKYVSARVRCGHPK